MPAGVAAGMMRIRSCWSPPVICHRQAMEEGREDGYAGTRRLLFDAGHSARENGIPFDEARTAPWKQGWVVADITMGEEAAF